MLRTNTYSDQNFFEIVEAKGFYAKASRLKFYLEDYLFKGISFKGKNVIDIGGGNGLFGFYPAVQGANKVVVMEPEFDGSTVGIQKEFEKIRSSFEGLDNIVFNTDILQNYKTTDKFDVILMHNSINHLDEEACVDLKKDPASREKYHKVLKDLAGICNEGATLIVCDCARNSFYSDIGLSNPFAKSIEWEKHQNPKVWIELLKEVGFSQPKVQWSSYNAFGKLGRILFGNRMVSYLLFSHFKLQMVYTKDG